jgi:hypothetical protein
VVYRRADFDVELNTSLPYSITAYKIFSSIRALGEYEDVVWLDTDCVATRNIDRVWELEVDGYPLLPLERFNNFSSWPHGKPDYRHPDFLGEAKRRTGVTGSDFNNVYLQSCCMRMNRTCLPFLREVLGYYIDYDSSVYPYGDESIINCLLWREGATRNLGDAFLCTHYFSPYIIEAALRSSTPEEYQDLFDGNHRLMEDEDTFILNHGWSLARHNRIGLVHNNYGNLLFLHGTKDPDLHRRYLHSFE